MSKRNTSMTMRCRKADGYNYDALDSIQYVPSIEFVTSDQLVRIASVERGNNDDYPRHKVMMCLTINEALDLAAAITRECVKAAEQ